MSNDEIRHHIETIHFLIATEQLPEPWQQERARESIRAFQSILSARKKYERSQRRERRCKANGRPPCGAQPVIQTNLPVDSFALINY